MGFIINPSYGLLPYEKYNYVETHNTWRKRDAQLLIAKPYERDNMQQFLATSCH